MSTAKSYEQLLQETIDLQARLADAEETLRAIRSGEVDALVVSTAQGNQIFTLQGADRPYRVLIEEMQEGAVTLLVDGIVLYCNRRFAEIISYPLESILSQSIYQHFIPEDRQRFVEFIQATQSPGSIFSEFALRNQQGEAVPVQIAANALQFSQLLILGLVITDLRERRRTDAEIARLAAIVTSSKDAIITKTLDGIITSWNRGAERIFGYTAAEMIQHSSSILFPAEKFDKELILLQKIYSGEIVQDFDTALLTKDGSEVFVSVSISPLKDEKGAIFGASSIIQDISERMRAEEDLRKSESRFRTVFNLSTVGMSLTAPDGRLLKVNQAFATMLGYTIEEMQELNFAQVTHPEDVGEGQEYVRRLVAGEQDSFRWEKRYLHKDRDIVWADVSARLLRDNAGIPLYLIASIVDITERKNAEENLRKLNRTMRLLSNVKQSILHIRSLSVLFDEVCRIAVEVGSFSVAFIRLIDSQPTSEHLLAYAGIGYERFEKLALMMDVEPIATVLRSGEKVIINDIEIDPSGLPWREHTLQLGYRAAAAFPLKVRGDIRGTLGLCIDTPGFLSDEEVRPLVEMADDISFAIEFAETEMQRQHAETTLQQHVQAVEEMRLFLQTTFDTSPANTVVLDPDGVIISVNASWIKFANANDAQSSMYYLGSNYLTICDTATGPWSEEAASVAAGIRAVIDGQRDTFNLEYPCDSSSRKRWFLMIVTPFPEPVPRRVVVAHINITERKQAEETLRHANALLEERVIERTAQLQASKERVEAILNNSADAILLVRTDLTILKTNTAFNRMFACNPDDYEGKSLSLLVDTSEGDSTAAIHQIVAGQNRGNIDVNAQRKDGTIFVAELSVGSLGEESLVFTFHDITERKKFEQSLQLAVEKEKELNELKTRFVSMASHEFRTPLASIHAATETLSTYRQKLTDDQIEQKLRNIRTQVGYLKDIMDDVLRLAQLQTRRVTIDPEACDLDVLCREVIGEFQERPDSTHQLIYSCEHPVPVAQLDIKLMRQLISNLVSNAIKYSPESKTVIIKLDYADEMLFLSVRDSGIGIPESDLVHIFEPFHRASNVGTIRGTGLGLVIAKESIDLHGGTISVESQIGTGTTFTVQVPIR